MTSAVHQRLAARPAHSWRGVVPPFDDSRPLLVFDGVCVLCSRSMCFIAANDAGRSIQFTAAQSPLGQALFRHYDLDAEAFETVLLIENGCAFGKRDALWGIARHLRFPWRVGALYGFVPRWLADPAYDLLAGSRYRIFGRSDACMRPDASWADRVIE